MYNTFIVLLFLYIKGGKCADQACVHKVSINEAGCSGKSKVIATNPSAPFPQRHIIWCYRYIISKY